MQCTLCWAVIIAAGLGSVPYALFLSLPAGPSWGRLNAVRQIDEFVAA
jgi:hypothetical protein